MVKINLGNRIYAYVSDEDADLRGLNWSAHRDNRSGTYYACNRYSIGGARYRRWLHHEVMEAILDRPLKDGEIVDHRNQDKLDCRRENLRVATRSQNEVNKKKATGMSPYKGVSFDKSKKKWRALIYVERKRQHLGYFSSEIEAAKAYNEAALEIYKEFAILNEV